MSFIVICWLCVDLTYGVFWLIAVLCGFALTAVFLKVDGGYCLCRVCDFCGCSLCDCRFVVLFICCLLIDFGFGRFVGFVVLS